MENIEVNKATVNDVALLQQISRQTFSDTFAEGNAEEDMQKYLDENFSQDKLQSELRNENSEFYFALLNEKVIGYLKVNTGESQTEIKDEDALEIERIYVLKDFLGKNVGKVLYDKAIAIAKDKNVSFIWLGVWEENLRAIRFYEKNGFEAFDKHIFRLGDDEQTDIMMKLQLK